MEEVNVDHLGNVFKSTKLMCKHWEIPISVFWYRIKHGYSIKDALEMSNSHSIDTKDHLGNCFKTNKEMCKHWEIEQSIFYSRVYLLGWTIEKTLTTPVQPREVRDHLGNTYENFTDMCIAYNKLNQTVWSRVYLYNWALSDALTIPVDSRKGSSKQVTDHTGEVYASVTEMCLNYGISTTLYMARLHSKSREWTLKEILTTPARGVNNKIKTTEEDEKSAS